MDQNKGTQAGERGSTPCQGQNKTIEGRGEPEGHGVHGPQQAAIPEKLGPWRTQLQDATDQALALVKRGRSRGEVELTDPYAAGRGNSGKNMNPHIHALYITTTAAEHEVTSLMLVHWRNFVTDIF